MREDQNRQSRRGPRKGGRFNDRRAKGSRNERTGRFRKGSKDIHRKSDQDGERRGGDRIRRRDQKKKISKGHKKEDASKPRDLDSELMNYWVKSGKNQDQEGKNLAQQKLNEDLDNYWKQKSEKVDQKPKQ